MLYMRIWLLISHGVKHINKLSLIKTKLIWENIEITYRN